MPPKCSTRCAPTRTSCRCSSRITKSARCNPWGGRRGGGASTGRARARRCVRGRRALPGRFSCPRRGSLFGHGPQVRRTERCGRAAGATRTSLDPFVVGGAQERARRAESRMCPRGWDSAPRAPPDIAVESALQRTLIAEAEVVTSVVPGVSRFGPSEPDAALPNLLCLASRESRPSRSCSRSTSTASQCTRDRRALRRRSNRRRCSPRWSRRRPFATSVGRLVVHGCGCGAVRGSVPGNRRTTQGVASAMTAAYDASITQCSTYATRRHERGVLRAGARVQGGE